MRARPTHAITGARTFMAWRNITAVGAMAHLCAINLRFAAVPTPLQAASPVNGTLSRTGSQQLLNLWGTHYQMGYAHGYLLADQIRNLVDAFLLGAMANGNTATYASFITRQQQY